ncbi:hypothetical protein [Actinotignum sp. GS-2025f]|uniref:hypothetical protein n=1 Tax=Actinotignum sp. GS-2025f TaxID=3427279 RepID=UPI003F481FA6
MTITPPHIKVADPLTNEGLAMVLKYLDGCGWGDEAVVERLSVAIGVRARSRLAVLVRQYPWLGFDEVVGDLISRVWEVMRTRTRAVVGARFRWAYAISRAVRQFLEADMPAEPVDYGGTGFEEQAGGLGARRADYEHGDSRVLLEDAAGWSAGAQFLVGELVARGVDQGVAWHGMRRMLELSAQWGFHTRTTHAREDRELARLGISKNAIGAWMGLINGSRREGAKGSFLLGFARGRRSFTEKEEFRLKIIVEGCPSQLSSDSPASGVVS